jgi:REP element-mobilizing transposase RayT
MRKFHRYSANTMRLQNWDYGWDGIYFVTICTYNRQPFFGKITNSKMIFSEIGLLAKKFWLEIPSHFSFVSLDAYCIMPNHIHGILMFNKNENKDVIHICDKTVGLRHCLGSTNSDRLKINKSPGQLRYQNQGKNTLSSVIGSYKSAVSRCAHNAHPCFRWQNRFYDRLIRDNDSFFRLNHYIQNNPRNWETDELF